MSRPGKDFLVYLFEVLWKIQKCMQISFEKNSKIKELGSIYKSTRNILKEFGFLEQKKMKDQNEAEDKQ